MSSGKIYGTGRTMLLPVPPPPPLCVPIGGNCVPPMAPPVSIITVGCLSGDTRFMGGAVGSPLASWTWLLMGGRTVLGEYLETPGG